MSIKARSADGSQSRLTIQWSHSGSIRLPIRHCRHVPACIASIRFQETPAGRDRHHGSSGRVPCTFSHYDRPAFSGLPYLTLQSQSAILELIPLFHLHFSYAFPSIRISTSSYRQSAPHLINAICAITSRYSTFHRQSEESAESAAHTWATKAKEQVSLQLAVPSLDTVETLLILAWVEFGQDRDSVSLLLRGNIAI